ncbi:MAG: helix-turn-helix domain-containing protein [Acidobacteriota bacterium]|nr:helix-turn-helix domain-containing protein [Acidobacteriota bacterium]
MPKIAKSYKEKVESLNVRFIQVYYNFFERGVYLSPAAKLVYITLKSFENAVSKKIFPTQEKIQEKSNLSKNAVTQALKELEYFGWIKTTKICGRATRYKLLTPINPMEKFEEKIYPIPSRESADRWRKSQRINKSRNRKTFAEKFEEKKQSESKYEEEKVSQVSSFEYDWGDEDFNY